MSVYTDKYQGIIEQYIEAFAEAEKRRKPGSGLFGFGQGPGDYPCHDEMDRQVAELAGDIAENGAEPEETASLVWAVFRTDGSREWPEAARLAVLASQRHMLPLIPKMTPADRNELLTWYEKAYPRRKQLPVQKQIVKALRG